MIWINPLAWFALAAVAVPVLIHLLAHRRAERVPFPTLRFVRPTRLAAIRRRALEDVPLLIVRSAIVAAAAAAFAGPLVVTPGRRASWNGRLVRAIVGVSDTADASADPPFKTQHFEARDLSDGIHRAVAWLESAPPARRELAIAAPLAIGSVSDTDLAAVPSGIGVRFVRTEALPAVRSVVGDWSVLTRAGAVRRTVTLAGRETSVRDDPDTVSASWPVDVVAPPDLQHTADAALAAVLSLRVRRPPADHRARLILLEGTDFTAVADAAPIRTPWIADAVARIARDSDLMAGAARVPTGLADARFARLPWHALATAADGRPIASAAAWSERLMVAAGARADDLMVPVLLRAIANSLAPESDVRAAEVLPIADAQLRAWTRQPGPPPPPRPETVEWDDRRWVWVGILVLLALEAWMRRSRGDAENAIDVEAARVA